MHRPIEHLTFGVLGNVTRYLLDGWGEPERGYAWALGPRARLRIPCPQAPRDIVLEFQLRPMVFPPAVIGQTLIVIINGVQAGTIWADGPLNAAFPVPQGRGGGTLLVELVQPDAASPRSIHAAADDRALGFAVSGLTLWPASQPAPATLCPALPPPGVLLRDAIRGLTGLAPPALLSCFESLGQNCEFGMVQRAFGVEQLGLPRFAGISQAGLIAGLADGFAQLPDPGVMQPAIDMSSPNREYFVRVPPYLAEFHSGLASAEHGEDELRARMRVHFEFLRRKFLETLAQSSSVFVLRNDMVVDDLTAWPVFNALRAYGDHALVYVVTGDRYPPGTVECRADGLYRGWRARNPAMDNIKDFDMPSWFSICAHSYRLWRQSGRGGDGGA